MKRLYLLFIIFTSTLFTSDQQQKLTNNQLIAYVDDQIYHGAFSNDSVLRDEIAKNCRDLTMRTNHFMKENNCPDTLHPTFPNIFKKLMKDWWQERWMQLHPNVRMYTGPDCFKVDDQPQMPFEMEPK